MSRAPIEVVRDFFKARGGAAKLGDLYAHMAGQAASRTVRETSRTVEALADKGELIEGAHGEYRLCEVPEATGQKGQVHERLWRAAHRRTERNGYASTDQLAAFAHCTKDAARKWVKAMLAQRRLTRIATQSKKIFCYKIAPGQPGPEQPPEFRWPRRGKAKSRKDMQEGSAA